MTGTAVLLCGHGSRDPEGVREFEQAAAGLRPRLPDHDLGIGYLEFARPTIRDGLVALAALGARRIYAIPAMLFAASHVKNDLPREIDGFAADNVGIDVRLGRDLGVDARLLKGAAGRIDTAIPDRRADMLLLVVGRGSSDPHANSNIAKIAGTLRQEMGFGRAETAFGGVVHPRVDAALRHSATLGFRRIVVFPYFLFTGVLVKRIYADTDRVAAEFPAIEFVKALYLRDHPLVLDAFVDRVGELTAAERE